MDVYGKEEQMRRQSNVLPERNGNDKNVACINYQINDRVGHGRLEEFPR